MKNEWRDLINKEQYGIDDLLRIMQILRGEGGCPWDAEQTHRSIATSLIEEAYECKEAIDRDSDAMLCEELGDLLLQVVFHAQMAQEEGKYTFADICTGICKKMIVRHPHVFADGDADTSEKVLDKWDQIKAQTKGQKSLREQLDGVCTALPALMRAGKLGKKAAKAGQYTPVSPIPDTADEEAVGQALFSIAARCAVDGIDCEEALQKQCEKFAKNFD